MIISHKYKFVVLGIQKTASRSIQSTYGELSDIIGVGVSKNKRAVPTPYLPLFFPAAGAPDADADADDTSPTSAPATAPTDALLVCVCGPVPFTMQYCRDL